MADAVDMSLDDIIKQQRKNHRGNKPRTNNSNNNKVQAARSKIRPKLQRRQVTKTSPIKDKAEQMLHISNLHFGVSNKDLRELFEDIGPLKKATVHYDKSGRSLGTAEVTFFSRDAAIRAINKYDQRHLDGRPMNIKLVPSRSAPRIGLKSESGIQKRSPQKIGTGRRPQQGQNRSPRKGNLNNRKGGKPGSKRPAKQEVTAAQLDAELESYKEEKMNVE